MCAKMSKAYPLRAAGVSAKPGATSSYLLMMTMSWHLIISFRSKRSCRIHRSVQREVLPCRYLRKTFPRQLIFIATPAILRVACNVESTGYLVD